MSEGVVANLMALINDAAQQIGIRLPILSDNKKRGGNVFPFQNVKYSGRPLWIRAIVKRERD